MQADSKNLQTYEQEDCEYISDSEQESSEYEAYLDQPPKDEYISDVESDSSTLAECSIDREQEGDQFSSKGTTMVEQERNEVGADLGQQPTCEFHLVSESDFSVFAEYSRDRYACEAYDQCVNQEEPMMTDDCIGNYMFLTDPYSYDFNIVLSSSSEHFSEEKVIMMDDQDLNSREQNGHQSSSREVVMVEKVFSMDQHVSCLCFKDPVAAFIEFYIIC